MGGGRAYRVWHTGQARMCVCVREREVACFYFESGIRFECQTKTLTNFECQTQGSNERHTGSDDSI